MPLIAGLGVRVERIDARDEWKTVKINPEAEFRRHFEAGDTSASVPDLIGVGLVSDGDQTRSRSSADYTDFVIKR